ncbi:hypothetical protein ACFCWY_06785 [Streptomyces sp. NPDC056362]|uniref:hypothetical protein n=2 Tax=unclassified Streptomyces TaxID=2593676 RepID=UPI0035D6C70C
MGYTVSWTGEDLHELLRTDDHRILDYPFAAFVVALATEIDRDALDWLRTYRRAVDSVTGPAVAFLTFSNASLHRMRRLPDPRRPDTWHSYRSDEIQTIDVPDGVSPRDFLIEAEWTGKVRSSEVFARTMTYESDSFARALGVHTDQLPCLVFFDEPSSGRYHLVSMRRPPEELLACLRTVMGDYYARARDSEYFRLLADRRRLEVAQIDVDSRMAAAKRRLAAARTMRESVDLSGDDPLSKLNGLREVLDSTYEWCLGKETPEDLRHSLDELLERAQAVQAWQRLTRTGGDADVFRAALAAGEHTVEQDRALRRTYGRLLRFLDPATARPGSAEEWLSALDRVDAAHEDPRMVDVERRISAFQSVLAESRRAEIETIRHERLALQDESERIRREGSSLVERLRTTPRPSLEEAFRNLAGSESRTRAGHGTPPGGTPPADASGLLPKMLALLGLGS